MTHLPLNRLRASLDWSIHTLRYYERIGLLEPVRRDDSSYREYGVADIAWIQFLKRLRATGMPVRWMKQFARLRHRGPETISEGRAMLESHQAEVKHT